MKRKLLGSVACVGLAALGSHARGQSLAEPLGPAILHRPLGEKRAQQGILTPVPIALDLPPGLAARRVLVHYKMFGRPEWQTLELRASANRYSGSLSCFEVSTVTGDIQYYIRVHDPDGRVIAYSGSRHSPYRVRIINEVPAPGAGKPSGRCPDPADCPPGLAGCPSEVVQRIPCKRDIDCEGGTTCGWDGFCEVSSRRANWLSLDAEAGLGLVATSGACALASQESEGYACYRESDGASYLGRPVLTNEPLRAGPVPVRLAVGYERLVFYDTSIGVRLGYAIWGAGPTSRGGTAFVPFSGELRVTHWFGDDPLARLGLRPYVAALAGYGMLDTRVTAHVREDPTNPGPQGGNDLEQRVRVWRRGGDGYVGLGLGAVWAFAPHHGLSCEARLVQAFPFASTGATLQFGVRRGF